MTDDRRLDLEEIRARIARMSDTELSQAASYRFAGIFVRNLCNTYGTSDTNIRGEAKLNWITRGVFPMVCQATVRQAGDVAIVDLRGRITLGDGSWTLRDTLKRLIAAGHRRILLNLKDVSHIDSAGMGELVGVYATVTNQNGQIRLLDAQTKVLDVLRVTRLDTVFENFTDETAALRSLAGRASAM